MYDADVLSAVRPLTFQRLTPHMGAEVSGIDLMQPISDEAAAQLRSGLAEHLVLFFRDQPIDFAAHKALGRVFGELHVAPASSAWTVPGHPEVTRIHADADSRFVAGDDWHSDMSCDPEPPLGSILHLPIVPETGGDTAFANMFAAYDALSDRMKAHIEGLTATHDAARVFGGIAPAGTILPRSSHPVVRTHPVSRRRGIFVNKQFTASIDGVPKDEGRALLDYLNDHVQRPEFQCRFRWGPNSIAVWDNRSVQHSAIWDYFPATRSGFRVQIKGDVPF